MRNALIALLAANLVYFAWAHWVDEPKAPPVNAALAKLPRLQLISELSPEQRPGANTRTALNEAPACTSVGPFFDPADAAKAAGILTGKGFAPQQRAAAVGTSEGFWVYVGGLKSDVEADRVRVSIEKDGIKDALVMPSGADADRRVSLGLFSDRAHADQRADSVKHLGFKAEVAERRLPQTVYWIDVTPRSGPPSVPLADLLAAGVGAQITVQSCPTPPAPQATAATSPAAQAAPTGTAAGAASAAAPAAAPAAATTSASPPAATSSPPGATAPAATAPAPAPSHTAASAKASAALRR